MKDENRDRWHWLSKLIVDKRTISKNMRKVESATIRHTHKFIIKRWANVREVQKHVILWVLFMGILIAATGLQLMWYQQSYKTTAPANNGTYAEAVLGPIDTLNPLFANTSAEQSASHLMFSSLLRYDKTGNLGYDLASDMKVNDAKNIYTISIRPDAKWHDGFQLTANDVAFTIGLMQNPNTRTTLTGWKDVSIKVIDDMTIEFTLQTTYAAFEHALTFPIVPKHILGGVSPANIRENSFSQSPIGSGPFKLRFVQDIDVAAGRKIIYMARNDSYYGGIAKLERFQLHVYSTSDAIIRALSLSEVNAAADLSSSNIDSVDLDRYTVLSEPIKSGVYAIINTKSQLLQGIVLRRALQLAIETNAIREKLPVKVLSLDLPFTNDQMAGDLPKALQYDQVSAKKYLDDAGWLLNSNGVREKDGKELKLSAVTVKDSELERVLEALSGQWRDLGIVIETQVVDPNDAAQNVVQTILQPRNFDILLYRLNIGADPDVYAYWHSSQASAQGSNFANYSNPISDDALSSARARVEPTLRNAKYITFAKQWLADVPAIGLYQSTTQYISSKNVNSFDSSNILISPIDRYSDILNWSAGSQSIYKTP